MAKISFTKLGLKTNQEIKILDWNGNNISIKQYLPLQDKLILISNVINYSAEEANFANPIKVDVILDLEILFNYTDLTFTSKQKDDIYKLYDLCFSSGLLEAVKALIPERELQFLYIGTEKAVKSIYDYKNSVLGILEAIEMDYSNMDQGISQLVDRVTDQNNFELLRQLSDIAGPIS